MLTSKQLIERAGISRATLNNYIALGILPRPVVRRSGPDDGRAPRIGFFPTETVSRIDEVNRLKQEGLSMNKIAAHFRGEPIAVPADAMRAAARAAGETPGAATTAPRDVPRSPSQPAPATPQVESRESVRAPTAPTTAESSERRAPSPGNGQAARGASPAAPGLRVTIADIPGPAYMINNNFEIVWWNEQASHGLFGLKHALQGEIEERNVFRLLAKTGTLGRGRNWSELASIHLALAKKRLSKEALADIYPAVGSQEAQRLDQLYDEVEPIDQRPLAHRYVTVTDSAGNTAECDVYISFFREGILLAYIAKSADSNPLLELLSRRDQVIRDLLQRRMPFLTHVACLVADLQNSVQICAELPPEEYFALINHIWQAAEPVFRRYYGTHGKHVGDGMVYYFFPQPDCNYVLNAIYCAQALKEVMREVSKEWRARKNWLNELYLNTGLNEGQEWFGTYHTATNIEFTVLGDTINHAARISDLARKGSVWVTKNMMGRLTPEDRAKVRFGIRRRTEHGDEVFVSDLYARVSSLVDLNEGRYLKFRDIATLALTEVVDLSPEQEPAAATSQTWAAAPAPATGTDARSAWRS